MKPLRPKVVGIGAMNVDELYRVRSVLADDESSIEAQYLAAGGSAANTIYGLAKLGVPTGFIGAVGDDEAGEFLIEDFKAVGVDISGVKRKKGQRTGKVLGLTDAYGKRALYVMPGANDLLNKDDVDLEYAAQAQLIHLSSFVQNKQLQLQRTLVDSLPSSVRISFSPGAIYSRKGLTALVPILRKTYVLFLNKHEAEQLTGTHFKTAAKFFLSEGSKIVVTTMGKGETGPLDTTDARQLKLDLFQELLFDFATHEEIEAFWKTRREERPEFQLRLIDDSPSPQPPREEWRFSAYVATAEKEYYVEPINGGKPGKDSTGAGDAFACGFLYGLLQDKTAHECAHLGVLLSEFCISEIGARKGLPTLSELNEKLKTFHTSPLTV